MADSVSSTVIRNKYGRYAVKIQNESDGTGETDVVKVDVSTLTSNINYPAEYTIIEKIEYSVWGMNYVVLKWDSAVDVTIAVLNGQGILDFRPEGGLLDPKTSGYRGDILLTTDGAVPGSGYEITIWLKLKGRSLPLPIEDQVIEFGALTLSSAGGAKAIASDGSEVDITSVTGVSGVTSGWTHSGGRLIRTTGTPAASNGAVLSCGTSLGTINVTISTIANGWSVASDAELKAAAEHASLAYGDTIYIRNVTINGSYADYRFRRSAAPTGTRVDPVSLSNPDSGYDLTTCNYVKITKHTGASPVVGRLHLDPFSGAAFGFRFTNLTFRRTPASVLTPSWAPSATYTLQIGGVNNIVVDNCVFEGTEHSSNIDLYRVTAVSSSSTSVYFINNTITNCHYGFQGVGGTKIIGNTISKFEADAIQLSGSNLLINWNTCYNPITMDASLGFHADFIQVTDSGATADTDNVRIVGNLLYNGTETTAEAQGIFLADIPAPYYRNNVFVAGNLLYSGTYQGISAGRTPDPVIVNNTVLASRAVPVAYAYIALSNGSRGILADNIANSIDLTAQTPLIDDTILADEDLTSGEPLSYEGLFAGPLTEPITTPLTSFAIKSGGLADVASPKHGAIGTGYIDYSARTYDFPGADPLIVSSSPADNATNFVGSDNITITFDRNIQLGTGNIVIRVNNSGTWSDWATYNAASAPELSVSGRVLTINPASSLDPLKEHAIRIASTAIDLKYGGGDFAGIADDTTLSFTTAADNVTLVSSNPADNATTFYDADNITLTFDRNIQFGTGNIVLRQNNSGWSDLATYNVALAPAELSISGAVLTINPASNLVPGREYAIRIASTAIEKSGGGNAYAGIANDTTLSFTARAAGITAPYFFGVNDFGPANTVTTYLPMDSLIEDNKWVGATTAKHPMPCAGTVKNLHVRLVTALSAGTSWAFAVMKNESAQSLEVTFTNGVDFGTDKSMTTNPVSFTAGDFIGLRSAPTGTPTANTGLNVSFAIETTTNDQPLFFHGVSAGAGTTNYGGMNSGATEANVSMVMPTAGTISNIYAYSNTAPGAAQTYTATLFKNGSAESALEAQITNSSSGRLASDTTGSVSVSAGDLISVRVVGSASAASATVYCSAVFTPTISGEAVCFANLWGPNSNGTSYGVPNSYGDALSDTSNKMNPDIPFSFTARKLAVEPSTNPGTGKSWVVTLRENAADTALAVTVSDAETYDINSTTSVSFTQGNSMGIKSVGAGFADGGLPLRVGFVVRP